MTYLSWLPIRPTGKKGGLQEGRVWEGRGTRGEETRNWEIFPFRPQGVRTKWAGKPVTGAAPPIRPQGSWVQRTAKRTGKPVSGRFTPWWLDWLGWSGNPMWGMLEGVCFGVGYVDIPEEVFGCVAGGVRQEKIPCRWVWTYDGGAAQVDLYVWIYPRLGAWP